MNSKLVSKHPAFMTAALVVIAMLLLAACSPAATAVPISTNTPVPKAGSGQAVVPSVTVSDQTIANGAVTVADVVSNGPGWIVIHVDNGGKPGAVIGHAAVIDGDNPNVLVGVDATKATATLYAMLHTDAGTVGTYEFPGADVPVMVNGNMVSPSFTVSNPAVAGAMINMANNSTLGNFLVDSKGMTLYLWQKDSPGVSNCTGSCLQNWPPLLTTGAPAAGTGVDASKLGTITRSDGSTQVTYNNAPLYYFIKDKAVGDVFGQGVGSVWFVVAPDGTAITTSLTQSTTPTTAPAAAGALVNLTNTTALGNFLVDSKGMTLYLFQKDTPGVSNCSGNCAASWPPLLTTGAPAAGAGVDASKLGTITRSDGSTQVTYNNVPLYYFIKDKAAGDVFGQGVGSIWYVVAADGTAITTSVAPSSTATTAPAAAGVMVNMANTTALGNFLVDSKGMTLYMFTKDTAGVSNCSGNCAASWPPLLTTGAPAAGTGVTASKLGTITRADGSVQVTYNNEPLYYFAGDKNPGDTTGQGVGSVWYVVAP